MFGDGEGILQTKQPHRSRWSEIVLCVSLVSLQGAGRGGLPAGAAAAGLP
jgi:hypothetical protein